MLYFQATGESCFLCSIYSYTCKFTPCFLWRGVLAGVETCEEGAGVEVPGHWCEYGDAG